MESQQLDLLFSALAHPARRRMLDLMVEVPGISVKALASHFEMSRIAVMKHLKVLEECELLLSKKEGRVRHLFFNPIPIQLVYDRWTTQYSSFWASHLADIKTRIEKRAESEGQSSA